MADAEPTRLVTIDEPTSEFDPVRPAVPILVPRSTRRARRLRRCVAAATVANLVAVACLVIVATGAMQVVGKDVGAFAGAVGAFFGPGPSSARPAGTTHGAPPSPTTAPTSTTPVAPPTSAPAPPPPTPAPAPTAPATTAPAPVPVVSPAPPSGPGHGNKHH